MAKVSKELKIGIAFIFSLFILYFGISFLKGVNILTPSNSYIVVFDDVSGLTVATPVTINGFQIGQVRSFELDPNNTNRVVTIMSLNKDVKVPFGSKFTMDSPVLGSPTIALQMNNIRDSYYSATDTIVGVRKKGLMSASDEMLPKVTQMITKADSLMMGLNMLIGNPNIVAILANLNEVTSNLAQSSNQMNLMTTSLNKDIPVITANMIQFSDQLKSLDLKSTHHSIDETLKNIQYLSEQFNSKNGTIGLLLNDRQLYDSLNSTLSNASKLLQDVKNNPSRYINVKIF